MSARDLKEDIERVRRLIREEQEKFGPPGKNYLFESVDEELAEYLDEVRLGRGLQNLARTTRKSRMSNVYSLRIYDTELRV